MQRFKRISHMNGLKCRVDVKCGRKDGRTEKQTHISHLAKAGATTIKRTRIMKQNNKR